jgi:hypothetical protein
MTTTNAVLEVNRAKPGETRLVAAELGSLADNQVRLRVDRFALTANNVTYAVMGDMLGYWDFFPTGEPAWGRVPAMGWADVVESTHPDVAVGGRYFGWFPMAQYHDVTVSPTADGLRDDGAHRAAHAPVYRSYVETSRDPLYPADADHIGDAEDRHALLRGLFLTAFLADELFADEGYFGAESVVVLSASSKTAIGFAQRAAARDVAVVGVTSAGNREFVRGLPWYDQVVSYDEIATLPVAPTVSVDMAGNGAALAELHAHLGDRLAYSMIIGKSHHDAPMAEIAGPVQPQFFFAPTEVTRRVEQWGRDGYQQRCAEAVESFVGASHDWLTVRRTAGPAAARSAWDEAFDGLVRPDTGLVVTLHP